MPLMCNRQRYMYPSGNSACSKQVSTVVNHAASHSWRDMKRKGSSDFSVHPPPQEIWEEVSRDFSDIFFLEEIPSCMGSLQFLPRTASLLSKILLERIEETLNYVGLSQFLCRMAFFLFRVLLGRAEDTSNLEGLLQFPIKGIFPAQDLAEKDGRNAILCRILPILAQNDIFPIQKSLERALHCAESNHFLCKTTGGEENRKTKQDWEFIWEARKS